MRHTRRRMARGAWSFPRGRWVTTGRLVQLLIALSALLLLIAFVSMNGAPLRECHLGHMRELQPEAELAQYQGPPANESDRFTLVLNSYHRRDLLQKSVRHYSKCPEIDAIRVIWCEGEPPPEPALAPTYYSDLKEVRYDVMPDSSLNNRFRPIEGLRTEAVFSIDDDIYMGCSELNKAFKMWQKRKRSLVGFFPRLHDLNPDCRYNYMLGTGTYWKGEYSVVLTKAALLHRDYLEIYTNHMTQDIRDYVDRHHNCEDVAMQLLVSNVTRQPPEFINSLWIKDIGKGPLKVRGISSGAGHQQARSQCLNDFAHIYEDVMPLLTRPLSDHGSLWWIRLSPLLASVLGALW